MKKMLKRIENELYYYENDKKIIGIHENIRGDVNGLSGDVSGLRGNVDLCEITEEEREKGINIEDLILGE